MESRTQGSRPRSMTRNNPRPKPRTELLEAKARNTRGQGQESGTQRASVFQKEGLHKFTAMSHTISKAKKKKCHDLGPFFTNQKIALSSNANRAFSRICRLGGQGQGLYLQGQGLQNVFSRTSSRTLALNNSTAIQDKINVFFWLSYRKICIIFA